MCRSWTAAVHELDSTTCFTPKYARQFLLERLAFRAEDVVAALDDLEDPAVDRLALMNPREGDFPRGCRLRAVTCHLVLHAIG